MKCFAKGVVVDSRDSGPATAQLCPAWPLSSEGMGCWCEEGVPPQGIASCHRCGKLVTPQWLVLAGTVSPAPVPRPQSSVTECGTLSFRALQSWSPLAQPVLRTTDLCSI